MDVKNNDWIVIEKWANLIQRMFDMGVTRGLKKSHIFY